MAQNETTIYLIRQRTTENGFSIDADDIILMDHGTGSKRHRAFTVQEFIDFVKDGKLDGMTIGGSGEIRTSSGNPVINNFYAIAAGIIEAAVKFKVGGSEWVPGNDQPSIYGLYSLEAGNVDSANVKVDTLTAHTSGETRIAVEAMLVKSLTQAAEKLNLGPTQVNGDLKVTGNLDAFGGLTLTNHIWNASAADIVDKMNSLGNGQVAIIFNSGSSDVSFPATTGSPNPRSFSVPHDASVLIVKSGDRIYPCGGLL